MNYLKNLKKSVLLLGAVFILAGCTSPISTPLSYALTEFVGGPKPCDPRELQRLIRNNRSFNYVRLGDEKMDVYSDRLMGAPERVEYVRMENGANYELAFYQATSRSCEMASFKKYTHEVIAFENDKVIGRGHEMYQIYIKPHTMTDISQR